MNLFKSSTIKDLKKYEWIGKYTKNQLKISADSSLFFCCLKSDDCHLPFFVVSFIGKRKKVSCKQK